MEIKLCIPVDYEITFWQHFVILAESAIKKNADVGPTLAQDYKNECMICIFWQRWAKVEPTLLHISNKNVYFQYFA